MVTWKKTDSRADASLFPLFLFESGTGPDSPMAKSLGTNLTAMMLSFHGDRWDFYEVPGDWERVSEKLEEHIRREPAFVEETIKRTYQLGKKVLELTGEISSSDLAGKSNDELCNYYAEYCKRLKEMRGPAWIAPALDLSGLFSKNLEGIILRHLPKNRHGSVSEYFIKLTAPSKQTLAKKQDKDLLKLAARIKSKKDWAGVFAEDDVEMTGLPSGLDLLFEEHAKKYGWLPCTYEAPPWDKKYYVSIAASLLRQKQDPQRQLDRMEETEKQAQQERRRLLEKIRLSPQEARLFEVAREIIFFKADRKDIFFQSYYQVRPLIREIAKRLSLTPKQVMYLLPKEMEAALKNGKADASLLNARRRFSVALMKNDSTMVFVGKEAERMLEGVEREEVADVSELKGQCAQPGKAKGAVKLILSQKDLPKMKEGDILVSNATDPNMLQAMKKAAAIVTNTGGITCHAAIVSRELGKPCVIGTKIATEVLKDGDLVEVNAGAGIVRRIR